MKFANSPTSKARKLNYQKIIFLLKKQEENLRGIENARQKIRDMIKKW